MEFFSYACSVSVVLVKCKKPQHPSECISQQQDNAQLPVQHKNKLWLLQGVLLFSNRSKGTGCLSRHVDRYVNGMHFSGNQMAQTNRAHFDISIMRCNNSERLIFFLKISFKLFKSKAKKKNTKNTGYANCVVVAVCTENDM